MDLLSQDSQMAVSEAQVSTSPSRKARPLPLPSAPDLGSQCAGRTASPNPERTQNTPAMDHRSFRDQLISIGFAIGQNGGLLRRLLKEHITGDTREQLAKRRARIVAASASPPMHGNC